MKHYTGIGSRLTPEAILVEMTALAGLLAPDYTLRSGHAQGADQAFERGAGENAEVYLPWPQFNADDSSTAKKVMPRPSANAFLLAAQHHPAWQVLPQSVRRLHARNAHQVLGETLYQPSEFLVCWTADGSRDGSTRRSGGSGQALRIAAAFHVPVYNLFHQGDLDAAFEIAGAVR